MNIFESLEQLNVSEECFDDIMGIVEEIVNEYDNLYDHIVKFSPEVTTKHLQKFEARNKANDKEIKAAAVRELGDDSLDNVNKMYSKRYETKNTKGKHKTKMGQMKYADGIIREKNLKQAIEASIARNKAKQEKKNN